MLAATARASMRLPAPVIRTSPRSDLLVGLPTWLWVESQTPTTASASVPGMTLSVSARPIAATWHLDGVVVSCPDLGMAYRDDDPVAPPTCGHTFTRPGEVTIRVSVRWQVTWSGDPGSGALPDLTTTAALNSRVIEVGALNTGG
ncbi:hypothetical protein [Actinokineospora pegani]|uniref:hypothetical protein n=1 Tax=Actinokineospora pegani TaxID=2654637 RepID=UPI0012EAF047|nr:hypothetical protein [Actinokineospora pegani]